MTINTISNKESLGSIRSKLNSVIQKINSIPLGGVVGPPGPAGTTDYLELENRPVSGVDVPVIGQGGFSTEVAFTAANIPAPVNAVETSGYYAPGDGGGHRKIRVSAPGVVQPWHKQSADGAWWEVAEIVPTPRMFGARGDGVTSDRLAVIAADAYAAAFGRTLYFTKGSYPINQVDLTAAWSMSTDAVLKFNGTNAQRVFTCALDGRNFGDLNVDFNGVTAYRGLFISGNRNKFGHILLKNMTCTLADNDGGTGLYVLGRGNSFASTVVYDFINSGHTQNDSMPQGVTLSGEAIGNSFAYVYGDTVRALIVDNSSGRNQYGEVHGYNVLDNIFYGVGTDGQSTISDIIYDGTGASASALGVRHGASCAVGRMTISGTGGVAVFFDGAKNVDIGEIVLRDASAAILSLVVGDPLTPTDTVRIGSIRGTAKNCFPFALQSTNGDINHLSIGEIDIVATLDATFALTNTNSFIRLDAAKGLDLGDCKVEVVLNGYTAVNPFYAQINSALTYKSTIKSWKFGVFNSDRVTPLAGFNVLTIGNAGNAVSQAKLNIGEGCFTTAGALRYYDWGGFFPNRLVNDGIPTVGYGKAGEVRWAQAPSASLRGWICTAPGTPGTWSAF